MSVVLKKGENMASKRHAQKENNVKSPREKSKKAKDCQQTPGAVKEKEGFPPPSPRPRGDREILALLPLWDSLPEP